MSAITQIHTAGSSIHKALIKFFDNHPIPETTLQANRTVLKALYEVSGDLWKAYADAVSDFSNDASDEERLKQATKIGQAALAIRTANNATKHTVITENQVEVTIAGLTADEIKSLKELHELVLAKMQASGEKGGAENANQMVAAFKQDMECAKIDNTFPYKWIKNHGVWKCCQHEKQKGGEIVYSADDPSVKEANREAWKKVVEEFNKHKDDAIPQKSSLLAGASNKFSVDIYCATINRYRNVIPENERSWEDLLNALEVLSGFMGKSSIKKQDWLHFLGRNTKYKKFFSDLDESNFLYDNPGKLTKARLFACVSSVHKAPDSLALFGVNNRLEMIPKMIAKIYDIEKENNIIDKAKGTTSTSEHLCHVLLTLGATNSYVHHRNQIPKSIREVKFNLN